MSAQLQTHLQTLPLSRLSRLRRQELIQRHVLRLICLGIAVLSLAGLLYLTQRSAVTTTTYEIQELQLEKERLQRKRDRLRADIARLTAPERVSTRAEALGFEPAHPTEFLAINMATINVPSVPVARISADIEPAAPQSSLGATSASARPSGGDQRQPAASVLAVLSQASAAEPEPTTEPFLQVSAEALAEASASLSWQVGRWLEAMVAALQSLSPPRHAEAWSTDGQPGDSRQAPAPQPAAEQAPSR